MSDTSDTAEKACADMWRAVIDLAIATGAAPITDKVWRYALDDKWTIAVNGFKVETDLIPPFHLAVEYNGWPAGIIACTGEGCVAAGEGANIWTLRDAAQAAVAALDAGAKEGT